MEPQKTVYSIWLLAGIKEHEVVGSDGEYLLIQHGGRTVKALVSVNGDYYPTRETAVDAAIARCQKSIAQAEKEIKSNRNAIRKLEGMRAEERV